MDEIKLQYSLYLLPGIIIKWMTRLFIPTIESDFKSDIVEYFLYSVLNYGLWTAIFEIINKVPNVPNFLINKQYTFLWMIFLGPFFLGLIWGQILRTGKIEILLRKIRTKPLSMIGIGWDKKFSSIDSEPEWILVTLKDGEIICGVFGSPGVASADPKHRDLYIPNVYDFKENEPWEPIPNNAGVVILGDQIKHIRFYKQQELDNVE